MNWYYVRDGQQDGPHSNEALQRLLQTGSVDGSTLIWREGMENWQPLAQAAPELLSAPPSVPLPTTLAAARAQCVECGNFFPASEMVSIGGASVCARCKPLRLQKMQEGVAGGDKATELARLLKIAEGQRGVNVAILLSFASYAILVLGSAMLSAGPGGGRTTPGMGLLSLAGLLGLLAALIMQVIYVYRLASSLQQTPIVWVLGVIFLSCIGLILLLVLSSKATKELRKAGFKVGLLGGNPKEIKRRMLGG